MNTEYKHNIELSNACASGDFKEVEKLIKKGANILYGNDAALRLAAQSNNIQIVKYLIEKGANIESNNYETLAWSAINGNLDMVKYLIIEKDGPIDRVISYSNVNKTVQDWALNYKNSLHLKSKLENQLINKDSILKRKI